MLIAAQVIGTMLGLSLGFVVIALFLWVLDRVKRNGLRLWLRESARVYAQSAMDAKIMNEEYRRIYWQC